MQIHQIVPPAFLQKLMPRETYCFGPAPAQNKTIYLTFDDGPVAGVTDEITAMLKAYQSKATFFCVGENANNQPKLIDLLVNEGHLLANHTYNHLNGWKTPTDSYLENIDKCSQLINSKLFRPPYGRITRAQWKAVVMKYKVVLWSVLSGDYNNKLSPDDCARQVIGNIRPGSIVVFHDSQKASKNVLKALPMVLEYLSEKEFNCITLNSLNN